MRGEEREKEEREREKEQQGGGEADPPACRGQKALLPAALRELFGLFQASGLWLQALDHRGQCEAGLFGDVFSAGPVCLLSVFLAVDTSVVLKQEESWVCLALTMVLRPVELVGFFCGDLWALGLDFWCSWKGPLCGHPEPGGLPRPGDDLSQALCPCLPHPGRKE